MSGDQLHKAIVLLPVAHAVAFTLRAHERVGCAARALATSTQDEAPRRVPLHGGSRGVTCSTSEAHRE